MRVLLASFLRLITVNIAEIASDLAMHLPAPRFGKRTCLMIAEDLARVMFHGEDDCHDNHKGYDPDLPALEDATRGRGRGRGRGRAGAAALRGGRGRGDRK
jgi:hypothetical protein